MEKQRPVPDHWLDHRYWRLGLFYHNPSDRRVFVPRRSGMGDTLNLAQPGSWGILALLFALALVVIVLLVLVWVHQRAA